MATNEVLLALLRKGPAHGYDIKRDHDAWFPDARPLAFGQVYATLGRLERSGHVEVLETRSEGGPERTVYALTERGEAAVARLARRAGRGGGVERRRDRPQDRRRAAHGSGRGAFLARQRAAHLRRMRELTAQPTEADPAARLARDHLVAHLDADLRWLDLAVERVAAATNSAEHAPATHEEAAR